MPFWCCRHNPTQCNERQSYKRLGGPAFDIHLTLIGPFAFVGEQEVKAVRRIVAAQLPFPISLTGIKIEPRPFTSLYIGVAKNQTLLDLRRKLCQIAPLLSNPKYQPHISLVYGDHSEARKLGVINALPPPPRSVIVNKLSVVHVNEAQKRWNIVADVDLKVISNTMIINLLMFNTKMFFVWLRRCKA